MGGGGGGGTQLGNKQSLVDPVGYCCDSENRQMPGKKDVKKNKKK